MLASERRRRILALVRGKGSVLVTELEQQMEVSRMTIYRDLDALVAEGLVEKVHGGVVAVETAKMPVVADPRARPLGERLAAARPAKRAIAQHLSQLLAGVRTAVVDNSSTVYYLSETIGDGDLFLVSGGVSLYLELQRRSSKGVRVALHGGEPHERTGSLVGPLALGSLRDMRFDLAIVSSLGVLRDEGTVFVSNPDEGEVKRAYLEAARKRVLAVDSTKLGQSGPYLLTKLDEFDYLVTESGVETLARGAQAASAGHKRRTPRTT